jgi:hypothetical protein
MEQWQRLYDLAEQIKALKPWMILEETDLFGVRDPKSGVDNFISVMGSGGEHFAVAVYIGVESLFQFWMLQDPNVGVPPEMVLAIRQVQLSFEDRDDLDKADIELIRTLQRKYRGKQAWPVFRSFMPGYLPWQIDASEASLLIHALEQTIDVVTRARKDISLLEPPDDNTYLIRVPKVADDAITWEDRLIAVQAPNPAQYVVPMRSDLLEQVKTLPKSQKSSLELDFLPLPQPVADESGRPYLPTVLLAVDGSSGMILINEMIPPAVGLVETILQVPQALAEGLVKLGYVPGVIKVQNPMAAEMAKFLQNAAGWKVKQQDELKMLNPALNFLFSTMEMGSFLDEDDEDFDAQALNMLQKMLGEESKEEPVRHRGPGFVQPAKPGKAKTSAKTKASKPTQVYQLKITLKDVRPPIWRRVLAPDNLTLNQLHQVIQVAMGWYDAHLHEFEIAGASYGSPDFDFGNDIQDDNKVRLNQVIGKNTKRFRYTYDFGDDWVHVIEVEKVLPYEQERVYPLCLAGKRACPPEDVGGVWGYESFLATISDPSDPEYEEMLEWVGGEFDPEEFDLEEVNAIFASMSKR